jgi:hypothetical protein
MDLITVMVPSGCVRRSAIGADSAANSDKVHLSYTEIGRDLSAGGAAHAIRILIEGLPYEAGVLSAMRMR